LDACVWGWVESYPFDKIFAWPYLATSATMAQKTDGPVARRVVVVVELSYNFDER
jgi:hypothetical protein